MNFDILSVIERSTPSGCQQHPNPLVMPATYTSLHYHLVFSTKNIIGGIAYPAHKYGRILYEAA